jgi:hypothetical protein
LASNVVTLNDPPRGWFVDEVLAPNGTSVFAREWRRWRAILTARRYDVIHFNFGSSLAPGFYGSAGRGGPVYAAYSRLLEQRDLDYLRGRALFVTFQGDDVRPTGDPEQDALKRHRARRFVRMVDGAYVLNPDLLDHVPGAEFLPYASVDPREWTPRPPGPTDLLRVVHAPSDRARKGTDALLLAFQQLRAEGLPVELELVEGRTPVEARAAYARADVIVDQLVVGWYGAVAVEGMALAKPVVAYLSERDLGRIPPGMRAELPVVNATAATIAVVLRDLASRARDMADIGRRGRAYVERWHDPRKVAARMKDAYETAIASRAADPRRRS